MAGRPRGLLSIVPVNDVLKRAQIINEEKWCLATLLPNLKDSKSAIKWCAGRQTVSVVKTFSRTSLSLS